MFEKILTFVQVLEVGSYVGAATKLGISKAAVSKQISNLEKELGIQLIRRTTRRLALTEEGKIYYQYCHQLIETLDEMRLLVSQLKQEPTGTLKLLSSRYFAEQFIVPYLGEFLSTYPKVKLVIELAERIPDLNKEEIDLVVGVSIAGPPDSVQKSMGKTRYVFCASSAYLAQYGVPQKPMDLVQHRYITHSMRRPDDVVAFGTNLQVYLKPILHLNDARAMVDCAVNGLGIIKVHHYMVQELLMEKKLIEVLPDYSQEAYPLYFYYSQNRYLAPKIRHFIDFLLTKVRL